MIILISQVCVRIHNMIVDFWQRGELRSETSEEGEAMDVVAEYLEDDVVAAAVSEGTFQEPETQFEALDSFVERSGVIMSPERHIELQSQLAQHLWVRKGSVSI